MRKILYSLGIAGLLLFSLASCSDAGTEYGTPQLEVVSSDVLFSYSGGTGTIVVSASGNVTATVDSDWCSVESVSGNTITVAAIANTDLIGRAATITVKADGKSANVTASQKGEAFSIYPLWLNYAGQSSSATIKVTSDYDITATPNDSWVSCEWDDSKRELTVTVEANDLAFTSRNSKIIFTGRNGLAKSIEISQKPVRTLRYEDFIGTWTFYYNNSSSVATSSTITIAQKTAGKDYTVTGSGLPYPLVFDYNDGELEIYAGQVVGTYTDTDGAKYNIYIRMVDDATTSSIANGAGMRTLSVLEGDKIKSTFKNNGVYAGGTGFGIYRTVGTTNTVYAKYRTNVYIIQQ